MVFCGLTLIYQQKYLEGFPELRSDRKPKFITLSFHSQKQSSPQFVLFEPSFCLMTNRKAHACKTTSNVYENLKIKINFEI